MMPFWKWIPAEWAHDWAPLGVRLCSEFFPAEASWRPLRWKNLEFPNPLGLAGGVDKNAELIPHWRRLGFGFAEIGTVTPLPQMPNPGKIVDRSWERRLLWNKMGFPSAGMREVAHGFRDEAGIPIFVNVGKNRATPNERAAEDYEEVARFLAPAADGVVVNVSSPNTKGLRDLQDTRVLRSLVERVTRASHGKPVLVKFSPDEEENSLRSSLDAASEGGAEGFVLTNTTLRRPQPSPFPEQGGVSGAFLKPFSIQSLKTAVKHFSSGKKPLLVSVGGILSPEDVKERLDLGADLVQIYSALVFEGPGFPRKVAEFMRDGGPV